MEDQMPFCHTMAARRVSYSQENESGKWYFSGFFIYDDS